MKNFSRIQEFLSQLLFRPQKPLVHNTNRSRPRFLLVGMPVWDVSYPPLALAYVCSIIQNAGWECQVEDMNIRLYHLASEADKAQWDYNAFFLHREEFLSWFFHKYQKHIRRRFLHLLNAHEYDLIGFSVNLQSRYLSLRTIEILHALQVDIPIVFGGADCSSSEYGQRFLAEHPLTPDIILQGDAEIALQRFLTDYQTTRNYRTAIQGFAFKDNEIIIDNGPSEITSLRTNPLFADYSQFDFQHYRNPGRFASFLSRGCINQCAFCNERFHFKRFRIRKAGHVVQEIQAALPYVSKSSKQPFVAFSDSIFNGHLKEVERLCEHILESGIQIHWSAQVSFSQPIETTLLEKMYNSGCRQLFWGLETGSQPLLDRMGKNFRLDQATHILLAAAELGIRNNLPIIVGFPGETPEDILTTVLFVLKYRNTTNIHFSYVSPIEIKTNSKLYLQHDEYGIINPEEPFEWETHDHRNTADVRFFRKFIMDNAISISNPSLSSHSCVDLDVMNTRIDCNSLPLASDIVAILYLFGRQSGKEQPLQEFIEQWQGTPIAPVSQEELEYWRPDSVPKTLQVTNWFNRDKNSPQAKEQLLQKIFDVFKDMACEAGCDADCIRKDVKNA